MNTTPLLGAPLPPPARGFERLSSRILERRRKARTVALGLAVVMSIPFFFVRPDPSPSTNPRGISVSDGAALEWPSSRPDVRIFLIAHTGETEAAPATEEFDESRR
jgi:hypothetical protein